MIPASNLLSCMSCIEIMFDQQDIQYIDQKFEDNNKKIIAGVGEMLEQLILPRIDGVEQRLDKLEGRFDKLEGRFDKLEGTVANLPTKSYLDAKLADVVSDTVQMIDRRITRKRQDERAGWQKIVEVFKRNNLATAEDLAALEQLSGASS